MKNEAQIERDKAIEQVAKNNIADFSAIFQFAKDWVNSCYKQFTVDDLKKDFLQVMTGIKLKSLGCLVLCLLSCLSRI